MWLRLIPEPSANLPVITIDGTSQIFSHQWTWMSSGRQDPRSKQHEFLWLCQHWFISTSVKHWSILANLKQHSPKTCVNKDRKKDDACTKVYLLMNDQTNQVDQWLAKHDPSLKRNNNNKNKARLVVTVEGLWIDSYPLLTNSRALQSLSVDCDSSARPVNKRCYQVLSMALRANVLINKIQFFIDPCARLAAPNPIYNSAVHYWPTTEHRFICGYEFDADIKTVIQLARWEHSHRLF